MRIAKTAFVGLFLFNLIVFSAAEAQIDNEQDAALKVLLQRRLEPSDPKLQSILDKAHADPKFRLGLIEEICHRIESGKVSYMGAMAFRSLAYLDAVESLDLLRRRWESMGKISPYLDWANPRIQLLNAVARLSPETQAIQFLIDTEQDAEEPPRIRFRAAILLCASGNDNAIEHIRSIYENQQKKFAKTVRYSLDEQKERQWPQEEWDQDADMISQYAELGLLLDPENADTDGDGIIDGNDRNPLMKTIDRQTEQQQIAHSLFFMLARYTDYPLSMGPFNFRVWVVQTEQGPKDIKVPSIFNGIILHLNREQLKKYHSLHGYGTPIISIDEDMDNHSEFNRVFHLTEYIAPLGAKGWEIHVRKVNELWLPVSWEMTWIS